MFSELDEPILLSEISKAINQLTNGKSAELDRLINAFFVHGKHVLLPYLHTLFNRIFTLSYFEDAWSIGELIPLQKSVINLMLIIIDA